MGLTLDRPTLSCFLLVVTKHLLGIKHLVLYLMDKPYLWISNLADPNSWRIAGLGTRIGGLARHSANDSPFTDSAKR
jgi:hypothetical protein